MPDLYKNQEKCDKAVAPCNFLIDFVPYRYKSQNVCDKIISKDLFILQYCLDRYKTQKMFDKAVVAFLVALNIVLSWFVTCKVLAKIFDNTLMSNDDNALDELDSNIVTFVTNYIGRNTIDFNNINPLFS